MREEPPPPPTSLVERYFGGVTAPIATMGTGECITDNLLTHSDSRWYLRSVNQLELLIIPRKDWAEALRSTVLNELYMSSRAKSAFFQMQLEQTLLLQSAVSPSIHSKVMACASRPKSAASATRLLRPAQDAGRRQQVLPPGSFLPAGMGHGVVVAPRSAAQAMSSTSKGIGKSGSSPQLIPGKRFSPHLETMKDWFHELETNPAYRHASQEKRRSRLSK